MLVFAGPMLLALLDPYCTPKLDLLVDISFDDEDDEKAIKTRPSYNLKTAWRLNDYSIMEYILYYIALHVTIRKFDNDQTMSESRVSQMLNDSSL